MLLEALIDFIPNVTHSKLKDVEQFSRQVGGAPCNVAATVNKLGGKSEMITQLGNDAFGDIIVETIEQLGVGTQYISELIKQILHWHLSAFKMMVKISHFIVNLLQICYINLKILMIFKYSKTIFYILFCRFN